MARRTPQKNMLDKNNILHRDIQHWIETGIKTTRTYQTDNDKETRLLEAWLLATDGRSSDTVGKWLLRERNRRILTSKIKKKL